MEISQALKRLKMLIGVSPSENIISAFKIISEAIEELQGFKDKQEQGLLIELPAPLGETVYRLVPKTYRKIETITISEYLVRGNMLYYKSKKSGVLYPGSEIGKTVFLTHSGAEEALARMKGE